jgi:predicted XRE-type DNA-binding protein
MTKNILIDCFFRKAIKYDGDDCLIWPFSTDGGGYANFSSRWFKRIYGTPTVSRAICIQVYGPPPTGMHQAAHSCGNGHLACVNRKHLRWATQSENMADDRRGENHPNANLTEEQVLEIRRLEVTMTQQQIAEIYGVSQSHISGIIRKQYWSWLESQKFKYNGPDLFA